MKDIVLQTYEILKQVYSDGAYLKIVLNKAQISAQDRSSVTKICYGVLENDELLNYWLKYLSEKSAKLAVRIVVKIGMYLIYFLKKQPYAVTDSCVEAVKAIGKNQTSGYVNAVLRRFNKEEISMPKDAVQRLCLEYSYPLWAFRELEREYDTKRAEAVVKYRGVLNAVRFKRCVDGESYLKNKGVEYETTAVPNVFFVKNFSDETGFNCGKFTYQSIGSAAICEMIDGEGKLLDACAAPGGKAVNLAEKFTEVVACDVHPHRKKLIEAYANRMQTPNVSAIVSDSTIFNPEYENAFDCVLCDVPCSGWGVLSENPDIKLRAQERKPSLFSAIQNKILENCSKYVKSGGYIYYSTCTVFEEENRGVIKKFLSKHRNFEICDVKTVLNGITGVGIQFFPDLSSGAGFYFCKLKRVS